MAYLEHWLLFDTHDDMYFAIFNPYSLFSKEAEAEANPEAEAEAFKKIGLEAEADPEANLTTFIFLHSSEEIAGDLSNQ